MISQTAAIQITQDWHMSQWKPVCLKGCTLTELINSPTALAENLRHCCSGLGLRCSFRFRRSCRRRYLLVSVALCLLSIHRPNLWGLCFSSPGEDRCVAGMRGLPDPPAVKGLWMLQGLEVGIASGAIWGCSTLYFNSGLPSLKSLA